jgi:tetratricopeptide (TPR) repeat protein
LTLYENYGKLILIEGAGNAMEEHARAGDVVYQAMSDRLSPAEAHNIVRQRLERLAVLWGLAPADGSRLSHQAQVKTYVPGEIILPRGVRAGCLGLVVRGQVAVHMTQLRSARTVVVLLPGSTFGEAMLNDGRANTATLQALTRCEIWFLRRDELRALVERRKTERREATLRGLVIRSAVALALWILVVFVLFLPATRQGLVLVSMGIGQWCRQEGYTPCAQEAWTVAANLTPADANPLLALGALHFDQGQIATAEQFFEAAGTQVPDSPEVLNNLGLIYAHQGQHERAIAAFRRALELEPGIAAVEHNLGYSLQAIQADEEALAHYELALSLGGPRASTLANMAIAYFETEQWAKANEAARQAVDHDDALVPAYTVLGAVALESRQPEEALAYLQRATALDGAYSQAHFYLGLAYKSLDRPSEAVAAFERALSTADDEGMRIQIRRHLNELYQVEKLEGIP